MPTKHPAYLFTVGMLVTCTRPESEYYRKRGVVTGHYEAEPNDVRVVVKWDGTTTSMRYRRRSLAQVPFSVKHSPPVVRVVDTDTHRRTIKTYRLPKVIPGTKRLSNIRKEREL